MKQTLFPPLPLNEWRDTRDALKAYAQVAGKVRRALAPAQKHWWHVSLRVTATGLTTTPIVADGQLFEMIIDFVNHQTHIVAGTGQRQAIPLTGQPAADYCRQIKLALADLGLSVDFDESVCEGTEALEYDAAAVSRFWQAFSQLTAVFTAFKHGFRGESSPVQLWPHNFDLALLWLSGRLVPDQDPDEPEYADEQMNFGFVTGDASIPEPYFYATAYPIPAGFTSQPLPAAAHWHTAGWTGAILPYAALTTGDNPREMLLNFLQTAHKAGRSLMK